MLLFKTRFWIIILVFYTACQNITKHIFVPVFCIIDNIYQLWYIIIFCLNIYDRHLNIHISSVIYHRLVNMCVVQTSIRTLLDIKKFLKITIMLYVMFRLRDFSTKFFPFYGKQCIIYN